MRLGLQEPNWKHIAAVLARSDSTEQTTFFKAFVKECLTWGTHYQIEQQLAWVNRELTDEEKDALSMLSYKE